MKVAILSFYSGHIERGVEVWAESLKKELSSSCDVTIFGNTTIPINWNQDSQKNSLRRTFFLDYWSILIARFTFTKLRTLRAGQFDVIIPTNGGWQTLLIRMLVMITRQKMVVVGHSGIGRDDRWNLWCFPHLFIALSTSAQVWAKKVNPRVPVQYIPNGIDLTKFKKNGAKASIPPMTHPICIFVGSLEASKRPALAIEAVARIPKASLLMLGNGGLSQEIDELGHELLGNRFKLMHVPHEKIAEYYRVADIFTLPTWSREAFGMVYLEAMACGLPVVTSDDPIKREIVGDAGAFIEPTDPVAYSKVLLDVSKYKWGNKPRKQAEKFSWTRISEKYYQALLKLTNA